MWYVLLYIIFFPIFLLSDLVKENERMHHRADAEEDIDKTPVKAGGQPWGYLCGSMDSPFNFAL